MLYRRKKIIKGVKERESNHEADLRRKGMEWNGMEEEDRKTC